MRSTPVLPRERFRLAASSLTSADQARIPSGVGERRQHGHLRDVAEPDHGISDVRAFTGGHLRSRRSSKPICHISPCEPPIDQPLACKLCAIRRRRRRSKSAELVDLSLQPFVIGSRFFRQERGNDESNAGRARSCGARPLGGRLRRLSLEPGAPNSAPAPDTAAGGGTLILSGTVYGIDATGRRPLAGATVDISEPGADVGNLRTSGDQYQRPLCVWLAVAAPLLARATMPGYDESPVVTIGYLETSKTLDLRAGADRIDYRADDRDLDRPGGGINRRRYDRDRSRAPDFDPAPP